MIPSNASGGFSIADGIARLICIALFALVPFFIIPTTWATVAQSKMLLVVTLVIIAASAWLVGRLLEGALHIPRSTLFYATALLPVAYILSMLVSGISLSALVGQGVEQDTVAGVVILFSAFALSAMLMFGNPAAIRLALQSFIGGLTLLLVFQSLYTLMPEWFSFGLLSGETTNILGNWHDLGIVAGLAFFLAITLGMSGFAAGWQRIVLGVLAVASLFLVIVVHFRDIFFATSVLAFLASLVIVQTGVAHAGLSYARALRSAAPFLLAAVLLGAGGFIGPSVWDRLPERINITQTEIRPSWQGTFDTARQSLQAPTTIAFGSGPNSFVREWGKYKPTEVNLTPFWNADFNYGVGIIPTSIFGAGLFGLIAWGAIFLALFGLIVRYLREMRPLSMSRVLFGVSLLSVGYLVGYHLIYTPSVAVTGMLFLMMGLLVATAAGDRTPRMMAAGVFGSVEALRLILLVVCVLVVLGGAGLAGREIVSNLFVNRAVLTYQATGDSAKAAENIGMALLISSKNDRAHRAAAELGVVRLAQMIQANPQDEAARQSLQETLQSTIQHGLTAVSINEDNYQNWLLLAQIYSNLAGVNIEGSLEAAKNAYTKAFETNPKNPFPKLRLAQLAAASNDLPGARMHLQEALRLKQDFAAAYYLLSQIEAASGNGDAAVQAGVNAVQLVPEDPLGWYNLGYILYSGGAYADAAQAFQQALQKAPDYSNAMFYLGLTAFELGEKDAAAQIFDRIAQLNPTETWVAQISANIRAGKQPKEGIQQLQ